MEKSMRRETQMQIIINIDDTIYKDTVKNKILFLEYVPEVEIAIASGTPLPKGHGAIKDISQIEIPMCEDRAYETWVQVALNAAPTIIEADKAGEEE